ncbi:MAG: hypothetical protein U0610_19730 [bacterium]
MTAAARHSRLRRGLRRIAQGVGVVVLAFVIATLADLGPNVWRHLRFHDVVREPWDEITTDAVVVDPTHAMAFQGTTLSVFVLDRTATYRPVYSTVLAQFLHRLIVRPGWGFTTAGDKGMGVLDLSDRMRPKVRRYLSPKSEPDHLIYGYDMAVYGDRALVAARAGGFFVADVSDPAHPKLVGSQVTPGVGQGAAIDGESGWVSVGGYGVIQIDLASGAALTNRRIAEVPPGAAGLPEPPPFDVAVNRPYVYFGMGNLGLGIARTDGGPVPPNLVPLPAGVHIRGVSVDPALSRLCVADYASGVFVVDLLDPDAPKLVSRIDVAGTPVHVSCEKGRMVVTRGARGFAVYDVVNPASARLLGEFSPRGFSHFIELFPGHAAVAKGSGGVDLYALAADGTPSKLSNIPTRGTAQHVMVRDGRAFVSEVTGGLTEWDVSDPAAPRLVQTFEIEQHVRRTEMLGERIITVGGEGPVSVLRRDESGRLARTHLFNRPGYAWRAIRAGDAVWVAALHHGLGFVRFDAQGEPSWRDLGQIPDTVDEPLAFAAQGHTLYVADLGAVTALDVSNPDEPERLGRRMRLGITYPVGLAVDGDKLYVAAHERGLWVIELVDRQPKRVLTRCATDAPLMAVAARDGQVWIAPGSEPLRRIDPSPGAPGCS